MKNTFDLQNPWRNPGYRFPEEPYIERAIFAQLRSDLKKRKVTVIIGARQVGKTYLMKKLVENLILTDGIDPRQLFYFNFDAFNLIDLFTNDRDFLEFIEIYGLKDEKTYVFLDEAQRVTNIGLLIKRYYDLGLNIKFIVSGSSSLEIKDQTKEALTGRKHLFELFPITFGEFLRYKGINILDDFSPIARFEMDSYQRLMDEYVLFGSYPGVVILDDIEDKIFLLKEIYNSYIQKDISDFLKIEDIPGFNRLVQFVASQSGGLCKVNEIAKNGRLSRYYVEKYLFALEETYISSFLRPYFRNLGKALIKTPKLYFCDTGLRNAVFGQFGKINERPDTGMLIENMIFSEFLKNIDRNQLWFYRTNAGTEIDFLIIKGEKILPIEVKYGISRQQIVPKALYSIREKTGTKKAIVITRDYFNEKKEHDLTVLFRPACSISHLMTEIKMALE